MTDPLADVSRMVDDWEKNAVEKAAKYQAMQHEVERISITGTAAGGAVRVTVGNNGIPTDITMTDGVSRLRPEEIAAAVLEAMRQAQAGYPAELARVVQETVGDTPAARHIVSVADRNFPAAEQEPPPRAPRRDDDGDFSDDSFLG
ncbi:YbaB/EbfC family nucleoid-associated protein [Lentzea sp. NPDC051213]|uniref:YbaB/EbfC family nucleoid-associated protein n=1 Tax=Lentzea sp. NPDC051213 TaxID=3364126 RepID=UPI0037A286ED